MQRVEGEQLALFEMGPDMAKIRRVSAELRRATRARSTLVAYASDWRAFEAWCVSVGRAPMPASAETVTLYAAARVDGGLRVSTVERHVAAIAFRHVQERVTVPDRREARLVLSGARRQKKETVRRRAAFTVAELRKICRRLVRLGTAAAARDRAVLVLGFATALRRSSVAALDLADLRFVPRKGVVVSVRSGKTDQEGRGRCIGVFRGKRADTCPVRALQDWLRWRGEAPGPLFTRVRAGDSPTLARLNPEAINEMVKSAASSIGLEPSRYGGHSLRASFVTAAHVGGSNTLAIMERTGHKTVEMVRCYLRDADPFGASNPLARAL